MPDADEVEGAQRLALLVLAALSGHDLSSSAPAPCADLPPLLRCCLLLLPYLDADLAHRCVCRLRAFLRSILSCDPDPSTVPAVEVFVENFVVFSDQLRRYLTMADGAIQKGSKVSTMTQSCQDELRVMLELMSHHFLSSVQGEMGFEQFVGALSWSDKVSQRTPELDLLGAVSLVQRSYFFSMPVVAQAHFVLVASRCVGNGDLHLHLRSFEHAMNAYLIYLPALGVFDTTDAVKSPLNFFAKKRTLNSCIPDINSQKLNCQINGLLLFCKLHSDDDLHGNERDIFDISVSFIEENQHVFPEQFRQEAVIVVTRIVSNILGCAKQKETHELDAKVSAEIVCIAALLRLMGSSFLEIFHCIRQMRVADDRQNENHIAHCISETICLLGQYEANGLNRHDLFGVIGKPVGRGRASVLMLSHFAGLLICCLRMRFSFLWKGCIIMMMMAMNLMIDEEGSLGLFQFLVTSKDSAFSSMDAKGNSKGSLWRKSSTAVALQFNNLHKLLICDKVRHDLGEDSSLGTHQRFQSGDGRAFFEGIPGYKRNSSEWDDIMDFIECKPDADYSSWWTKHRKFKKYMDDKWIRSKINKHKDNKRIRSKIVKYKDNKWIRSKKFKKYRDNKWIRSKQPSANPAPRPRPQIHPRHRALAVVLALAVEVEEA